MRLTIYNFFLMWYLLLANTTFSFAYTHADTLRGGNGIGRNWWDVQHYDLTVRFDTATNSISGSNTIQFKVIGMPHDSLQIDLQYPMTLDSVTCEGRMLQIIHEENVWWIRSPFHKWTKGSIRSIECYFHGQPRTAIRPPWDGGFIWTTDSLGKPWISVACQGLGASAWWPCKDAQWDEPDSGQDMTFTVPDDLDCIGNGRLVEKKKLLNNNTAWHWQVKNPINNYDITFYIGDYIHWNDTLNGEKGILTIDLYALRYNESKARKQFDVVKPMLRCFEYWMGPYPFYEDGYKLVEAPYLGMEHQSAVAYGNKYLMGYLGNDRSGTGIGLTFDYIIVHETGHEWFGNSITAKDIADNWIHEGITTWSETLFVECMQGKDAADKYSRGNWDLIKNDRPLIGDYKVNNEGSGDIYRKGAAIMYMIRALMNDDDKFRSFMRGASSTFYHKNITTAEAENYIATYVTDIDMKPFFNQYLRTTQIPQFEFYTTKKKLHFRFTHIVTGFTLPVPVINSSGQSTIVHPTAKWQHIKWIDSADISFGKGLLITTKEVQ